MAKLPNRVRQSASAPRTLSPGAAVQLHQSRVAVAESVFGAAEGIAEAVEASDLAEASSGNLQDWNTHLSEHAAKTSYTPKEIKALGLEGKVDMAVGETDIDAYRVQPFLTEQVLADSIRERSEQIRSPRARKVWQQRAEERAAAVVARAVQASATAEIRVTMDRAEQGITALQEMRDFDEAANAIEALPIEQEEKTLMLKANSNMREQSRLQDLANMGTSAQIQAEIDKLEEGDSTLPYAGQQKALVALRQNHKRVRQEELAEAEAPYYLAMRQQNVEAITRQIEHLRSDKYSGPMDDGERDGWIGTLERELVDINKGNTAQQKVLDFHRKREFSQINTNISDGLLPSPGESRVLYQEAQSLVADPETPDGLRTQAQDFIDVMQFDSIIRSAYRQSPEQQQEYIDGLLSGDRSQRDLTLARTLETIRDRTATALENDSMGFAARTGMQVTPLPEFSDPSFPEALANRNIEEIAVYDTYGQSTGLLQETEADSYGQWAKTANSASISALSQTVEQVLGDRSHLFWDQVITAGGGAYAVAGTLEQADARQVFVGQDMRQDYTPSELKTLQRDALVEMEDAYGEDTLARRARADAAVNIYLAEGEDADMGEIVNRVLGGMVYYNGVSFEAPEPGATDQDIDFWMENLREEDLPFIRQGSGEDLKRQIDGGGIVLVPAGAGKYYLQRVDTGTLLTTGGNASQRATITWPGLEGVNLMRLRIATEREEHARTGEHGGPK